MANPEHIEWLLEGVDNWNRRRNEEDFETRFIRRKYLPGVRITGNVG